MSGLDLDPLLPIFVLVISGSIHPYIQQKCIDRGDSSFIAKPFAKTDSD